MNQIIGANLGDSKELASLLKVADLIYFDGPLLSLFRNKAGNNYLFYWCDADEVCNRWLVFNVSDKDLNAYLLKQKPLKQLIDAPQNGFVYCVDIDSELRHQSVFIVSPKELPEFYIPAGNSFYRHKPLIESIEGLGQLKIPIDGVWDNNDFQRFPHLFRQSYAFFYAFYKKVSLNITLPMRDGWSSSHLFNGLIDKLPTELYPKLDAVQYASPGAIVFKADQRVSHDLLQALNSKQSDNEAAKLTYDMLHEYLANRSLLGEDANNIQIDSATAKHLGEQAVVLARELNVPNPEWILSISVNEVQAAKIILAYYRLCDRVLAYQDQNRVFFPIL